MHAESDLGQGAARLRAGRRRSTLDVRRGGERRHGAREAGRAAARRAAARLTQLLSRACSSPSPSDHKTLADYTHIVGRDLVEEIRELAEPLKGTRVVHVSATAFGGGVSEILYTLVPLMKDVGLDVEWQVIYGREEFFNATKLMHNALQGAPEDLSDEQWDDLAALQRDERARARRRLGRLPRPRPAARRAAHARAREGARLGVALPHRPLDAQPGDDRAAAALHPRLPAVALPRAATTCPRAWAATSTSCRRRSTRWRRRTWRSRPRTPPTSASSSASTSTGR